MKSFWFVLVSLFLLLSTAFAQTYDLSGTFYLKVYDSNKIVPNPWWIAIYGKDISVDNYGLDVGDSIKAYDADGVYCGVGVIEYWEPTNENVLRYTPIYGDDPFSEEYDEGAEIGDTIKFKIVFAKTHFTFDVVSNPVVIWGRSTDWYGEPSFIRIFSFKSVCSNAMGDVNGSGFTDLSDLSTLIHYLTVGRVHPFCYKNADISGNNVVDLTDLVMLYSMLTGK